ncbi:MAG: hypothetical protein ACK5B4_11705, partial [Bacteroidota bacterium]
MRILFGCFILFFGWTTQLLAQTGVDTAITWKLAAQRSSDSTVVLTIQAKPEKGLAIFGLYAGSSLGGNIQIDSLSRPL